MGKCKCTSKTDVKSFFLYPLCKGEIIYRTNDHLALLKVIFSWLVFFFQSRGPFQFGNICVFLWCGSNSLNGKCDFSRTLLG